MKKRRGTRRINRERKEVSLRGNEDEHTIRWMREIRKRMEMKILCLHRWHYQIRGGNNSIVQGERAGGECLCVLSHDTLTLPSADHFAAVLRSRFVCQFFSSFSSVRFSVQ